MHKSQLILASTSKTRRALLQGAGLAFEFAAPSLNEAALQNTLSTLSPKELAMALARAKALNVSAANPNAWVIGADQTLEFQGTVLHKAKDVNEAGNKLRLLRGKRHQLHSAFACARAGELLHAGVSSATLTMREFSDAFLDDYIARTGEELLSSVGCYFIESRGIQLFERIEGDHFTILGLPLLPLLAFLRENSIIAI